MPSRPMSLRQSIPAILAVASLLAACNSGATVSPLAAGTLSPGDSAPPSVPPATPSADQSAVPSAPPTLGFSWPDGDEPAVTREQTGLDGAYINPGAIIEHEGEFHMFGNIFTSWPGHVDFPHLVSTDGATWELVSDEPAFTSDDVPFAHPGADVSSGFVAADGTWVLVVQSVNAAAPWEIGLATAPGPDGPWTVQPEPVLTAGSSGSIDSAGLAWPSVVATDDGFAMYYTAFVTPRRNGVIARATSPDGFTWTKDDGAVLTAEAAWEGIGLDRPRVARTADGYVMLYAGALLTTRGAAFSEDGIEWRRDGDAPVITDEDFPVDGRAWDCALVNRDGTLTYYLEIGIAAASIGTQIYRATAELP